jgi:phage major head subunit gpT-like protein
MKGLANLTISRFMFDHLGSAANSKAWYLIDDSKPWFVLQVRESATVSQEAMNAGTSFEQDVFRFKVSLQANADHIDPRFAWQGSDGSV